MFACRLLTAMPFAPYRNATRYPGALAVHSDGGILWQFLRRDVFIWRVLDHTHLHYRGGINAAMKCSKDSLSGWYQLSGRQPNGAGVVRKVAAPWILRKARQVLGVWDLYPRQAPGSHPVRIILNKWRPNKITHFKLQTLASTRCQSQNTQYRKFWVPNAEMPSSNPAMPLNKLMIGSRLVSSDL